MCRRMSSILVPIFLLATILVPGAVTAGDPPVITELEPLWNSSSSSGQFVLDDGTIIGRSYGRAVTWGASGHVNDLGTFGGDGSGVKDANEEGVVVGQAQGVSGQYLPAVWYPNGKMAPVPVVSTGYASAWAVNSSGEVVGTYRIGNDYMGFFWDGSGPAVTLPDLGNPGTWARDINDHGTVVGDSAIDNGALYPPGHAFLWTMADGMTDLGALTPDGGSVALYINNAGQIAGGVRDFGGVSRAAFWTEDGTLMEIGPDPDTYSYPVGINDQGQVAIGAYTVPGGYIWSMDKGLVSLGSLGGHITRPQAINEQGQVVGWSRNEAGDMHAFLWTMEDGMIDLGTLGGTRSAAYGINGNGVITGWSDVDPAAYPTSPWITRAVTWEVDVGGVGGGPGGCPSIGEILTAVGDLGLPKGLANALTAKLEAAESSLARGKVQPAAGQLGAFINQVQAKTGREIPDLDAENLIDLAASLHDCLADD